MPKKYKLTEQCLMKGGFINNVVQLVSTEVGITKTPSASVVAEGVYVAQLEDNYYNKNKLIKRSNI